MSSSSVVMLKRIGLEPPHDWYLDLDDTSSRRPVVLDCGAKLKALWDRAARSGVYWIKFASSRPLIQRF